MVQPTIMISAPYGTHIILVSGDIKLKFRRGSPRARALNEGGVDTNWRFDFRPISRRISETVRDTTKVTINH